MGEMSHFKKLYAINVNEWVEKKNGLSYVSWPNAWAEVKKNYPDATYSIKKWGGNLPYVFDPKTGYMVFTDVTIEGLTHEMWLFVMDGANKAMTDNRYSYEGFIWKDKVKVPVTKYCEAADMFDINKTIMRCLVKNLAMFGLGLYIYAGEDLPEEQDDEPVKKPEPNPAVPKTEPKPAIVPDEEPKTHKERVEGLCKYHKITLKDFGLILAELQDNEVIPKGNYEAFDEAAFGKMLSIIHSRLLKSGTQTKLV